MTAQSGPIVAEYTVLRDHWLSMSPVPEATQTSLSSASLELEGPYTALNPTPARERWANTRSEYRALGPTFFGF